MKLVEDRKVCWVDQYGGHHVGVTFLNDGLREGDEDRTLVRHKHTGELEYVNNGWLKDYPMERIPELVDASVSATKEYEEWKRGFEALRREVPVRVQRISDLHQRLYNEANPEPVVNAEPTELLGLFARGPILCGQGIVLRKKG